MLSTAFCHVDPSSMTGLSYTYPVTGHTSECAGFLLTQYTGLQLGPRMHWRQAEYKWQGRVITLLTTENSWKINPGRRNDFLPVTPWMDLLVSLLFGGGNHHLGALSIVSALSRRLAHMCKPTAESKLSVTDTLGTYAGWLADARFEAGTVIMFKMGPTLLNSVFLLMF